MKSILTVLLLAFSIHFSKDEAKAKKNYEQTNCPKVLIYDYQGNLVKTLSQSDIKNEEISLLDLEILETSDFAYTFNGDEYRFR